MVDKENEKIDLFAIIFCLFVVWPRVTLDKSSALRKKKRNQENVSANRERSNGRCGLPEFFHRGKKRALKCYISSPSEVDLKGLVCVAIGIGKYWSAARLCCGRTVRAWLCESKFLTQFKQKIGLDWLALGLLGLWRRRTGL